MEPNTTDSALPIRSTSTKRTTRACDACYARKIKCDAVKPRCNWCSHHDLDCIYERRMVRKKARSSSKAERAELLDRVDRLESLLASTMARKTTLARMAAPPTPSNASSAPESEEGETIPVRSQYTMQSTLGVMHFAGWRFGTVNLRNGASVFSEEGQQWLRTRCGVEPSMDKIHALSMSWNKHTRSLWGLPPRLIHTHPQNDMPDRRMVERYLYLYNHSFGCHIFPVIDPETFRNTIAAAYTQPSVENEYQIYTAQACIFAFLAFLSIININDATWPITNGEEYAMKGHRLLIAYCMDTTLETLQGSIMINMFHLFSGNLQYALYQASICSRMVFTLGAHTVTYPSVTDPDVLAANPSYRERYLLRNIFWVCYTLDKELSIKTGQPPCLQDQDCDITPPPPHVQQLYPHIMGYTPENSYDGQHLFPGYPMLSILKSKAYTQLYSAQAAKKTDAELLRSIRELDDDLENWRQSLPVVHRPTFAFTRETLREEASTILGLMAHLDYNHCMAAIHQATGRCQAWNFGGDDAAGVESSLALAVEASRSTLVYLQMQYHVVNDEIFWMAIYYVISAILTIFFNILHHPLGPESLKDLELINTIPTAIRNVPCQQLSPEKMQVALLDELVRELVRLGTCAVDKARREFSHGTN